MSLGGIIAIIVIVVAVVLYFFGQVTLPIAGLIVALAIARLV